VFCIGVIFIKVDLCSKYEWIYVVNMMVNDSCFGRNGKRGESTFRTGPMNSAKTEDTVNELRQKRHFGGNVAAYNHGVNSRDGSHLAVDGRRQLEAVSVASIIELREDLERRASMLYSRRVGENCDDRSTVLIDGISHKRRTPFVAVGIDEINLFSMTAKSANDVIDFLKWSRGVGLDVLCSGLLYDFRGEFFGHVRAIQQHVDNFIPVRKARCKAVYDRSQCGEIANHSQRVWSIDFAKTLGLGSILDQFELYDFANKDGDLIENRYVAAPYFDKTLRIEEEEDGRVIYFPVCHDCIKVPFKKEVFEVYNLLIDGAKSVDKLIGESSNHILNRKIVEFLQGEKFAGTNDYLSGSRWIRKNKKGLFELTAYHRTEVGTFSYE
jgi:thymidine kinase